MNNQRVIVIGGSSSIGAAAARLFLTRGMDVVIAGRDRTKLVQTLDRLGGGTMQVVDATIPDSMVRFFASIGPFDHLVLSLSGGGGGGPFAQLDLAQLRQGFDAKFWAYVSTLQAALPVLQSDGSVTLVTAGSARSAIPATAGLAAINGALEAMIRPLAVELAPLRVNVVSPGVIDTLWWNTVPRERKEAIFAQTKATLPVGRLGTPDDVAQAIVFVATNGFTTGTVIECERGSAYLADGRHRQPNASDEARPTRGANTPLDKATADSEQMGGVSGPSERRAATRARRPGPRGWPCA